MANMLRRHPGGWRSHAPLGVLFEYSSVTGPSSVRFPLALFILLLLKFGMPHVFLPCYSIQLPYTIITRNKMAAQP